MDTRLQILTLVRSGYEPTEIAHQLSISSQTVHNHIETAKQEFLFQYQEHVEWLHIKNLSRLEKLYRVSEPYAVGEATFEGADGQTQFYPPDRMWIKACIDIIKAEMEMIRAGKEFQEQRPGPINIEKFEQTIIAGDELYNRALNDMQETWLNHDILELSPEELLLADIEEAEVVDAVMGKRVGELEETVNTLLEDSEHDEE